MAEKTLSVILSARDQMSKALSSASKELSNTAKQLNNAESSASGASGSFGILNKSVGDLIAPIKEAAAPFITLAKVLGGAALAVGGLGIAIAELAQRGDELIALRASFNSLAAGIGQNADQMLAAMQKASYGLVDNAELIKQANNAILLGLPVTTQSMSEMTQAAIALGRAMGVDATKSMESIIVGLGRQSKLWLDNLGIIVNTESAYEKMAATLGKTADQLTDAEKKQAFFNATMDAAREKVADLGGVTLGFGARIQQMKVAASNAFQDLQKFISTFADAVLLAFKGSIGLSENWDKALQFNVKTATDFAKNVIIFLADSFIFLGEVVTKVGNALDVLTEAFLHFSALSTQSLRSVIDSIGAMFARLAAGLELVAPSQRELINDFKGAATALQGFGVELGFAGKALKMWRDDQAKQAAESKKEWEEMKEKVGDFRARVKAIPVGEMREGMEGASDATGEAAREAKKLEDSVKKGGEAANKFGDAILGALSSGDAVNAMIALATNFEKETFKALDYAAEMFGGDLGDAFKDLDIAGFSIGGILKALTTIDKELPSLLFGTLKALLVNLIKELPLLVGNIIPDLVIPLVKLLPDVLKGFAKNLPIMIDAIIQSLPVLLEAVIGAIFALNPAQIAASIIGSALDIWLPGAKEKLILMAYDVFLEIMRFFREDGIPNLISDLLEGLSEVWENIATEVSSWWERTIWKNLSEGLFVILGQLAAQFDETVLQPIANLATDIFNSLRNAAVDAANAAGDIIFDLWEQSFGRLPEVARQAGEFFSSPIQFIVDQFERLVDSFRQVGRSISGAGISEQITRYTGVSFQQGTPFVPFTGPAMLHRGEAVIPANANPFIGRGGIEINMPITIQADVGGIGAAGGQFAEIIAREIESNSRGLIDRIRTALEGQG